MAKQSKLRARRVASAQSEQLFRDGWESYKNGVEKLYNRSMPRVVGATKSPYRSFCYSYIVFEWCRVVRSTRQSKPLLKEIRPALAVSNSLASYGLYEVAMSHLRFTQECLITFLYFRDHPREAELAIAGEDVWELTAPKAVLTFLKRLPEFNEPLAQECIVQFYSLYRDLCRYIHPRTQSSMTGRRFFSDINVDPENTKKFESHVKRMAVCVAVLFAYADKDRFLRQSEATQTLLLSHLKQTDRAKIFKHWQINRL